MKIIPFLSFVATLFIGVILIINNSLAVNDLGFWGILIVIFAVGVYWARNSTKNKVTSFPEERQTVLSEEDKERLQNELDIIQGVDT